jgi:hypothetical protein
MRVCRPQTHHIFPHGIVAPSTHCLNMPAIKHPDVRVKYCAYGHSVATLLNPRGIATVSHKFSLIVTRHVTVVVAVPSTAHYSANYKIKYTI